MPGIEFAEDGVVKVGPDMMTGHPGIFAGGDMVPGERSVTVSVGHGKHAARHIDAWLHGEQYEPVRKTSDRDVRHASFAGLQRCRSEPSKKS